MYLHERKNWTNFIWDKSKISSLLEPIIRSQGRLYGRLDTLGFDSQLKATSENLLADIIGNSQIEGIRLNTDEVRSSLALKLGLKNIKNVVPSHYVDSVVSVMLDAIEHYQSPISKEKLCAWQSAFFPNSMSEGRILETGVYRTGEEYVVSGVLGREKIHFIAPSPNRVEEEMDKFIKWFNSKHEDSLIICSAIAHIWFVTIHPFEDGNGRLSRILADIMLARADNSSFRFYNISSEINRDKNHYYDIIERVERGNGDITEWLVWYLNTLQIAIDNANATISTTLNKSFFWLHFSQTPLTERQKNTLNIFLDGYQAKITTKNWAALNKCSKDTANRDITDLVDKNILIKENPNAKRPSYLINYSGNYTQFTDLTLVQEGECHYILARFKGKTIKERILNLDAERIAKGEIILENLIGKYFSYYLEQ